MSTIIRDLGIDRMSVEERLQLIGEIWDTLSQADLQEIPEEHRRELDRRLAAADADPTAASPWEEAKVRLRGGS
jgi:putative addiction module component (TIGR02574 family)